MTIGCREITQPAGHLLLSLRQELFDNHLAQIGITPEQQGTFDLMEEVLASAGVQHLDTSAYELSGLEDIQSCWENAQVEFDVIFKPGIVSPSPRKALNDLEMGEFLEIIRKPLCVGWRGRQGDFSSNNSCVWASHWISHVTQKLSFGRRIEIVSELVYRTLFEWISSKLVFGSNYKKLKRFLKTTTSFFTTSQISVRSVAASFCKYSVHTEKKVGQPNKNNIKRPYEIKNKKYGLSGDCFSLLVEDIVRCNCSWYYGKRCEKFMWRISVRPLLQKLKTVFCKSHTL